MRLVAYQVCLLFLVAGCSGNLGPKLSLTAPSAVQNGSCSSPLLGVSDLKPDKLRFTVRVHEADDPTRAAKALCDTILPVDQISNGPAFGYPLGGAAKPRVDYFVEAWNDAGERVGSGALLDQDPGAPSLPDLLVFATESFRCFGAPNTVTDRTVYRMKQARAFHTATPLPNGQILIAGGLTASLSGAEGPAPSDQFYILGTIEIYDPATGTFIQVKDDSNAPPPRAFHQAALLPSNDGTFHVMLVGGLSTTMPTVPALHPSMLESYPYIFRLTPLTSNQVTPLKHQETVEVITYDPVAKTIHRTNLPTMDQSMKNADATNLHPRALQAGAQLRKKDGSPEGIALAGGGTVSMGAFTFDDIVVAANDVTGLPRSAALPDDRVAASMIAFDDADALLVGGTPDLAANPDPAAFIKLGIGGAQPPTAMPMYASYTSPNMGARFPVMQFATATALPAPMTGFPTVLLSGGLLVQGHVAINPPLENGALYLVTQAMTQVPCGPMMMNMCPAYTVQPVKPSASYSLGSTCGMMGRWRPVAWNAATLLPTNDRVLLTGGTPNYTANGCVDCDPAPDGSTPQDQSLVCATTQAGIYDVAAQTVNAVRPGMEAVEKLGVARFGHTQTLLPDGKVIIIGGFTRKHDSGGWSTWGVGTPELFNPARRAVKTDPTSGVDLDDPVRAELTALHLKRDAGKTLADSNAGVGATTPPFITCDVPTK